MDLLPADWLLAFVVVKVEALNKLVGFRKSDVDQDAADAPHKVREEKPECLHIFDVPGEK